MITQPDIVKPLPSRYSPGQLQEKLKKHNPWFYKFPFANGIVSESMAPLIDDIHQVRSELIFPWLDTMAERRWSELSCLDIGCHEGWWSAQLALRGAKSVVGIDPRPGHIERASLIREVCGFENVSFRVDNLYELNPAELGAFDLTFFVGVLYHLDNPLGALSKVAALTREICVIETQVARPSADLGCVWGSDTALKQGPGIALVKSDPSHVEGDRGFVLVPTLKALYEMLYGVGFKNVSTANPAPGMYWQYTDYDRVVVFARK